MISLDDMIGTEVHVGLAFPLTIQGGSKSCAFFATLHEASSEGIVVDRANVVSFFPWSSVRYVNSKELIKKGGNR